MRKLEIDEYEELEDIEIALNKEIELAENKYNDFYIDVNIGKIIIDKKEDSDKYIIEFCQNGFICENPNIREFYEKKEFTKNELIDFLKHFKKNIMDDVYDKTVFLSDFINKTNEDFTLQGINIRGIATIKESGTINKLNKYINSSIIMYIQGNITRKLYRIEFYETIETHDKPIRKFSKGNAFISIVNKTPEELIYIPKQKINIVISSGIDYDMVLDFRIESFTGDDLIGHIGHSYNGGELYSPKGFVKSSFKFNKLEIDAIKDYFFFYDNKKLEDILKLEERIVLKERTF